MVTTVLGMIFNPPRPDALKVSLGNCRLRLTGVGLRKIWGSVIESLCLSVGPEPSRIFPRLRTAAPSPGVGVDATDGFSGPRATRTERTAWEDGGAGGPYLRGADGAGRCYFWPSAKTRCPVSLVPGVLDFEEGSRRW